MHRADLHEALTSIVPPEIIHLNKKLVGLEQNGGPVTLSFADGTTAKADAVIGADGVHSVVRDIIIGPDKPIHKGRIAYRAVFSSTLLNGIDIGRSRIKWWGVDRHIVIYYTTKRPQRALLCHQRAGAGGLDDARIVVGQRRCAGIAQGLRGLSSATCAMVLDACPDCHKWAILERDPLPTWSQGRVVLIGDACHPMTPYMAQGAATSIEDAAVLARCLERRVGWRYRSGIQALYEAHRKPRTSHIQAISSANTWMNGGNDDTRLALRLRRLERFARPAGADAGVFVEIGRGMSNLVTSSTASAIAPDEALGNYPILLTSTAGHCNEPET